MIWISFFHSSSFGLRNSVLLAIVVSNLGHVVVFGPMGSNGLEENELKVRICICWSIGCGGYFMYYKKGNYGKGELKEDLCLWVNYGYARATVLLSGNEALKFFKEDPSLFNVYHVGYQEQMSHWPELPVNVIIKWLKDREPSYIVADFGCGDARLSKNVMNKVYSIDLVSSDPSVIACDMSKTPLESSSVDVAVFCLSLMGTDFPSYLQEAHRVLKPRGWLLIAEVKSRFDPNTGGADPINFSKAICELGFTTVTKDFSNKMFILFFFKKKEEQLRDVNEIEWPELKPCLYKRR
ncbi:ribosomal RNA-processing protein 8 isoform X1 [Spinacia oleracea]|uniref:Ribosomal RNA-processing protein 8 n=1 Tax=Spinacia oleracea TaxID=3562 RepID=A0ABM3RL36_SPIOL|nr:ribosomal RNA-processing protein 8 isoform X1 [Spinacia oleracea]